MMPAALSFQIESGTRTIRSRVALERSAGRWMKRLSAVLIRCVSFHERWRQRRLL